ncbi:MAG: thiamine pyrophosphate-dependent enzyme [Chloroflexi bacterium]|nr:thiamine pyrophosphate-dependent enzyme [Chloroflexota bacterium]
MERTEIESRQSWREEIVYQRPKALSTTRTHYCPGCTHGIIHRLIAEVIDELGIMEQTIGVFPVGCAVFGYDYFNFDASEAAHGRAPAVATGIKRIYPDKMVFTYQGDGDLAAIGTTEIVHAAARGENITTIFVNNAIYGMTGGQMAPTTLPGQRTTSTWQGRDVAIAGHPVKVSEMLATQDGAVYIARTAVNSPANVNRAKGAIKKAFKVQQAKLGFALVEVLSACPVGWGLAPKEALVWITEHMIPSYPLGEFKATDEVKAIVG